MYEYTTYYEILDFKQILNILLSTHISTYLQEFFNVTILNNIFLLVPDAIKSRYEYSYYPVSCIFINKYL